MTQPVYPTLDKDPVIEGYTRAPVTDSTNRTPLADGAYLVTAKVTKVPLRWSFAYRYLSNTNKNSLMTFYRGDANLGAVPIKFTDPQNSTAYFVHFLSQPEPVLEQGEKSLWKVDIDFIEAIGTYT